MKEQQNPKNEKLKKKRTTATEKNKKTLYNKTEKCVTIHIGHSFAAVCAVRW